MSIPRYTCAESTLTISTGMRDASASATALLPDAVGPMSKIVGVMRADRAMSPPTHEEAVQISKRELIPRRPAVIALARAFGRFHLAQQRIHFANGQAAVRANGSVAGHRRQQLVALRGE